MSLVICRLGWSMFTTPILQQPPIHDCPIRYLHACTSHHNRWTHRPTKSQADIPRTFSNPTILIYYTLAFGKFETPSIPVLKFNSSLRLLSSIFSNRWTHAMVPTIKYAYLLVFLFQSPSLTVQTWFLEVLDEWPGVLGSIHFDEGTIWLPFGTGGSVQKIGFLCFSEFCRARTNGRAMLCTSHRLMAFRPPRKLVHLQHILYTVALHPPLSCFIPAHRMPT